MSLYVAVIPVSSKRTIEKFKYAVTVWMSFSERQMQNIYDGVGWDA